MIQAFYKKYILNFKKPSGTSRGVLKTKETWFLVLKENGKMGVGECAVFRGLSYDDRPDYENRLSWLCSNINKSPEHLFKVLIDYPSIIFGLEVALKSLQSDDSFHLFPSNFTNSDGSIEINGLIWMGSENFMKTQIKEKIEAGFNCIKIKIGALNFQKELDLLKSIRKEYSSKDIELRVDANGAFKSDEALEKLKRLSEINLHSIEQPIKQGQWEAMANLCELTPLPIALDEELIGITAVTNKQELLQTINPQYIILKPSLVGGYVSCDEWIGIAEKKTIGWWITSALESNIGLNAIAQYTYTKQNNLAQGLGTGGLFINNFESPLAVYNGKLNYNGNLKWHFPIDI